MDILQILNTARNNNGRMFPVMEAEKDEAVDIDLTDDSDEATDYNEDTDDAFEDDDSIDTGEEETTEDDASEEDNPDDAEEDVDPDQPTDYTDDTELDDVSGDDQTDSDDEYAEEHQPQSEEHIKNDPETVKRSALLDDFISLYDIIKNNVNRLNGLSETDFVVNKIVIQVKKNLIALQDSLFTLIIRTYSLNTYAKNLYLYNYFTQSLAINLEMLSKISVFTTNSQNKYIKNN